MNLVGINGITIQFHLLRKGRVSEYPFDYKNLFQQRQQGCAAFDNFVNVSIST
jgi:hypothetical protein